MSFITLYTEEARQYYRDACKRSRDKKIAKHLKEGTFAELQEERKNAKKTNQMTPRKEVTINNYSKLRNHLQQQTDCKDSSQLEKK